MLSRLDGETRGYHGEVDAYWVDLLAVSVTRDHYRTQLARTYGFEAPLESALAYTPQLVIADRLDRARSGLIAQDLLALGWSAQQLTALPQCTDIEPFADPAEALGWKYVVDRPTQLHAAIKHNLVTHLADLEPACAYLSAVDGIAIARWNQFGVLLEEVSARPGAGDRMLAGAQRAFASMTAWYRREQAR